MAQSATRYGVPGTGAEYGVVVLLLAGVLVLLLPVVLLYVPCVAE